MPVVEATLIEGYDASAKARLVTALTRAMRSVIAAPLDGVIVILNEARPGAYARGGMARVPGPPLPSAADVARDFLSAMEARDLARASGFLAPGFTMTFPGGVRFTDLSELVAWAAPRYRFVRKVYERFDEVFSDDGTVVYCFGTLSGEWPDGTPFAGIRFIDRFTVREGKLVDQSVWNDLAIHQPAASVPGASAEP